MKAYDPAVSRGDSIDRLLADWATVRPDLDFAPVGIVARLGRVRAHLDASLERRFAAHGLSGADFAVLVTLTRLNQPDGVSQRAVASDLGLTSGTVSVRMDRLVELELVERRPDPADGRNVRVHLTDAGRERFERVAPDHLDNERRMLAALGDEEQAQLAALLRRLLLEFEEAPAGERRLGLAVAPAHVTIEMRRAVGLADHPGLLVRAVEPGGAAAVAGVGVGDLLTRAGRRALRSVSGLGDALDAAGETRQVRLELLRGNQRRRVTLVLPVSDAAD